MISLIKEVKENQEDFEWYPTTNEILDVMFNDIDSRYFSILDIGAGNGKVFSRLEELLKTNAKDEYDKFNVKKYAIEKSQTLIENMPKDVFIVGTDFNEQTLIDKKVDIIFCNPPYTEYSQWTEKIIKEASSNVAYFVIPTRWRKQDNIKKAIKLRDATVEVLGDFDFLNSEDRKARAVVSLVKVLFKNGYGREDAFDVWFKEHFKFNINRKEKTSYGIEEEKREKLTSEIVTGTNLISRLAELYSRDFERLLNNYKTLEELDSDLLEELNVSVENIKEGLQQKIEGLKNRYWRELFDKLDKITDRLTHKSRQKLLDTLTNNTSVDFTVSNAYSIVIWAIKNANNYYDEQLKELYFEIASKDNIINYKSNEKVIEDGWRYEKKSMKNYSLDYRLVLPLYQTIDTSWSGTYRGLSTQASNILDDIVTVATNLGFTIDDSHKHIHWTFGAKEYFNFSDGKLFMEVKLFKNGNAHLKFAKEFMKKFNLEAGRLNGWIKTPKEASNEFDITEQEAIIMFKNNFTLLPESLQLLIE